ncbi:LOW QUALITY PROTEIN: adenosine 5'-monophosphoramidase HINT2-like [Sarcoramphus papa]
MRTNETASASFSGFKSRSEYYAMHVQYNTVVVSSPTLGTTKDCGETANRDAGSAGGDLAAQRAPRRAWPSGGSAGATTGLVVADEIIGARAARPGGATTVFGKVIGKALAANVIYEDEECLAFRDLSPQAPTLFLVMPKEPIIRLSEAEDSGESVSTVEAFCTLNCTCN